MNERELDHFFAGYPQSQEIFTAVGQVVESLGQVEILDSLVRWRRPGKATFLNSSLARIAPPISNKRRLF